ncbi:hypothetical protein HRW12_03130 [Streptomyces lunaelactis]|uniref:zinc finger protein n=1 Tax=Streptomyces lunaelactis TaxID=1535768 RepID=UPI001584FBA7|nr:zinc finger protein [Streptomyces lunaelactis]NUK32782.1 hypothetical protein [Streptomyces lunaelactis]
MATSPNWRCADCDTFNEPVDRACTICGSTRRSTAPARDSAAPGATPKSPPKTTPSAAPRTGPKPPPKSGPKRPAAKPAADWRCSNCDTNNARTDLSCIVCGTGWKAATAKKPTAKKPDTAAPKKAAPRKPTPKRTTTPPGTARPRPSTAGTTPRTGSSGTRRTSATGSRGTARPSPGTPAEGVFFPSTPTAGYTPPTAAPTPAPSPAPVYTPPPSPYTPYTPAPAKESKGCAKGCLGLVVLAVLLTLFSDGCRNALDSADGDGDGSTPAATSDPCPGRIAAEIPQGDGAELAEAFRTGNKQITLCRTTAGKLYYFGEFSDRREKGIVMGAEETADGYEARNGPYRYVIHSGVVTIYESGSQIGEEDVTPEPSPS